MVRSFTRTRLGYRLKRIARRGQRAVRRSVQETDGWRPIRTHSRHDVRNVLLVSHAEAAAASGLHVRAIAAGLAERGYEPVVAVPSGVPTTRELRIVSHRDLLTGRVEVPVDLVHAFTPRPSVRRVVRAVGREYVVHLEDDDAGIVDGASAAERDAFVAQSAGVTVVVERLLELKPPVLPGAVVWPGFDEAILAPSRARDDVRVELGVATGEIVVFYGGNVHETNLADVSDLYRAVALVRARGVPAVLVRSGWNFVPGSHLPRIDGALLDLGWVDRRHIPDLLHAADVLVQPGSPGGFNDYRFPSKLPEFLASGRPVVLPRTNIGLELRDREEALVLESGDADEIAARVAELAGDAVLAAAIGRAGRDFALRNLRWSSAADRVAALYEAASG